MSSSPVNVASASIPAVNNLNNEHDDLPDNVNITLSPPITLDLHDQMAFPGPDKVITPQTAEPLYSFKVKRQPIRTVLAMFAKAYNLNIILDTDITGEISVDYHDLPFAQAMSAILDTLGYYWTRQGDLLRVRSYESRIFTVDYIRLIRSGSGSSQATISSQGGDGGGGQIGSISIVQEDKVRFWDELESQLAILISKKGRLIVNRMSGTIQVMDRHTSVIEVESFLQQLKQSISRQADIEVKIVEVTLNNDHSLGIDWSRIKPGNFGLGFTFSSSSRISQPAGGITALPVSSTLNLARSFGSKGDISAIITALEEQGKVRIVSQPHIRTLNNQAAMIKLGTDRTFFRKEQINNTTTGLSSVSSSDIPQLITEGIVLSITPQISSDGWVMLDVSPIITRVASISEVKDSSGNVLSSAPNLDVRQVSSLVRIRDGETVVIGGLIQNYFSDSERKVSLLGDLPLVGALFKGKYKANLNKELVIFLTPRISYADETNVSLENRQ